MFHCRILPRSFLFFRQGQKLGEARLNVPGRHNVQNAVGVIALATELGIPFEKIAKALPKFQHARRRFEIKYASDRFLLVDDYAHHPTEIRATLADRTFDWSQSRADNVSAASLHPNQGVATGIWRRLRSGRSHCYHRRLSRKRAAHSRDQRANHCRCDFAHGHRGVTYQSRFDHVHHDIGNMLASGDLVLSLGAGTFTSNYRFWRRSWWSRKN